MLYGLRKGCLLYPKPGIKFSGRGDFHFGVMTFVRFFGAVVVFKGGVVNGRHETV